jgi:hypothetical protein
MWKKISVLYLCVSALFLLNNCGNHIITGANDEKSSKDAKALAARIATGHGFQPIKPRCSITI